MLIKIGIDPVAFTIGTLKVHWYGIMIAIGLYAGIQVGLREAARRGLDPDRLMNVALIIAAFGVLGGRLYYVAQNQPGFYLAHPGQILAVWQGGMAFYGAIFAGGLALLASAWVFKLPFWKLADVGVLGLTLGQAFGRIGNIINGDIVGYPTNGKWGFVYTNPDTFGPRNVAVQPASLYELLIALALFIFLWAIRKRVQPDGVLALLYVALYSVSQFFIFFLRDNIVILGGLKQAQVTALIVLAVSLPLMAYLLRRPQAGAGPEAAAAEPAVGSEPAVSAEQPKAETAEPAVASEPTVNAEPPKVDETPVPTSRAESQPG
jgi:phosphatidylglycerol---prolipoprotein diacylglyceryl transferase